MKILKKRKKEKEMSSSSLDHLSDFHAWLQQKCEQKVSFLPWVRTLLNDETIMGMKWDDFVGKPRPNRAGKKLDAFNALFQVFSKEKSHTPVQVMAQKIMSIRIYSDVTEIHALAQGGVAFLLLLTLIFSWLGISTDCHLPLSQRTSSCTLCCLLSSPRPLPQGARWTTSS